MTDCAIVLIPENYDSVWKQSSQKIPHMTLLYLGNLSPDIDQAQIATFVEHVAKTVGRPFGLTVDSRGVLGNDKADVLFFEKNRYDLEIAAKLRSYLLTDHQISNAYTAIDQYPEWTPHLTLGYPDAPAKKQIDEHEYQSSYVHFDRIAVWFDDYDGPTFKLESKHTETEPRGEFAMADTMDNFLGHFGVEDSKLNAHLRHYGVKGMQWGKRTANPIPDGEVRIAPKGTGGKLKTAGGKNVPAHSDAIKAVTSKQIAKSSSPNALSNKELKDLVTRMNLEQQYADLSTKEAVRNQSLAQKFVSGMLGDLYKQEGKQFIKSKVEEKFNPGPRREFDEQFDKARRSSDRR